MHQNAHPTIVTQHDQEPTNLAAMQHQHALGPTTIILKARSGTSLQHKHTLA